MRIVATCQAREPVELVRDVRDAARRLEGAEGGGGGEARHLVEVRLDLLETPVGTAVLDELVGAAPRRLLVTCRRSARWSDDDRRELLEAALARGAVGCDWEHEAPAEAWRDRPAGPYVLSHHGPASDAARVPRLAAEMASRRPAFVKIALEAGSAADVLAWADAGARAVGEASGWAPVAVGPQGTWLRLLAGLPGDGGRPLSGLCYVAGSAPLPGLGQVALDAALADWRVHAVSAGTSLHAVLGWPLAQTWSPRLHSVLFGRRGLDAVLVALPARDADEARTVLDRLGVAGAAVTMPLKQEMVALVSTAAPRVGSTGVLNTLRRRAGAWEAESFDGPAARDELAALVGPLAGRHVAVLGAGGAARALCAELAACGARVTVVARDPARARALAAAFGLAWEDARMPAAPVLHADALVNATPAGGGDLAGELPAGAERVRAGAVLDMVTTPPETGLVRRAREGGARVRDGLGMLARQAVAQQAWWTEGLEAAPCPPAAEAEALLRAWSGAGGPAGGPRVAPDP